VLYSGMTPHREVLQECGGSAFLNISFAIYFPRVVAEHDLPISSRLIASAHLLALFPPLLAPGLQAACLLIFSSFLPRILFMFAE